MKLQRITALLWRGEVYETRSVLFVPLSEDACDAFVKHPLYRELDMACKGIEWHRAGGGCMELLVKVFHNDPEGLWLKAGVIRDVLRHFRVPLRHVTTMHYDHREPKSYHCAHNHFTHRPIARTAKP